MTVRQLKQGSVKLRREAFSRLGAVAEGLAARPGAIRAAEWSIRFCLAAVLGSARVFGGAS
ncbi:MAG: hypothetical protein IKX41_06210, partial [Oscillospiraceae bacterium]|nr:hypothetical protein [Oscillospiraceae bacterium]